jgi:hypothetical protein
MQSEGVVIAIVSIVIATVVATTIVVAAVAAVATVGALWSLLLGHLIPNVEVIYHLFRRPLSVFKPLNLHGRYPQQGRR